VELTLGYLGALLAVLMVLPQLVRTIRHRELRGVAPSSWGLMAVGCLAWLVYGIRTDSPTQIPGNVLLIGGAVAVVLLVPHAWTPARRGGALAAVGLVVVVAACSVPPLTAGFLALGISLTSALPQIAESYGNRRAPEAAGLSLVAWTMRLAANSCWIGHALLAHDLPILVAASMGFLTTSTVFALTVSSRMAADDEPVLQPVAR
jgi:uncharacterized protein with PQ loop repeat